MQREMLTRDRAVELVERDGRLAARIVLWPGTPRETVGTDITITCEPVGVPVIEAGPNYCCIRLDDGRGFVVEFGAGESTVGTVRQI